MEMTFSAVERQEFSFGGYSPGGLGAEVPSGVQSQSPSRESGERSLPKLKQFADIVCRF